MVYSITGGPLRHSPGPPQSEQRRLWANFNKRPPCTAIEAPSPSEPAGLGAESPPQTRRNGCVMASTTTDIRNLVLIGHAGAGKTLLAEALLYKAGATKAMGELARGTTVCDFDPLEKEFQHSLDPAVCHCEFQGRHIN